MPRDVAWSRFEKSHSMVHVAERGARRGMTRRKPAWTLAPLLTHPTRLCRPDVRPYHYRPPCFPFLPLSPTCLPIVAVIGSSSAVDFRAGSPRRLLLHHDSFSKVGGRLFFLHAPRFLTPRCHLQHRPSRGRRPNLIVFTVIAVPTTAAATGPP